MLSIEPRSLSLFPLYRLGSIPIRADNRIPIQIDIESAHTLCSVQDYNASEVYRKEKEKEKIPPPDTAYKYMYRREIVALRIGLVLGPLAPTEDSVSIPAAVRPVQV